MEEIRKAASAYYANLSPAQKEAATKFFKEIDTNGDGQISLTEFMEFTKNNGHEGIANNKGFFKALDRDENGTLDFNEVVLVYYMHMTGRMMFCRECKELLKGVYFTCDQCFSGSGVTTYDLCSVCFHDKNFNHHEDAVFVDNHLLLLRNRHKESDQQSVPAVRRSRRERMKEKLQTYAHVATIATLAVEAPKKLWGSEKDGSKGNSNSSTDQSSGAADSGSGADQSAGTAADSGSGDGGFEDFITECLSM